MKAMSADDLSYTLNSSGPGNMDEHVVERVRAAIAGREELEGAGDDLARLVRGLVEQGEEFPSLEMLDEALATYSEARFNTGQSAAMVTSIDAKLWRGGYVLRRLVALTGFQAELVAYGGDFEVRGTDVQRDCRISIRREEYDGPQLRALTRFAEEHACDLMFDKHGVTLRPRSGKALMIEQNDTVEANSLLGGATPAPANLQSDGKGGLTRVAGTN